MKKIGILLLAIFPFIAFCQKYEEAVMFYNLENLFDYQDDPQINDEEFLPESVRRWNANKFYTKVNQLSKVIIHAGGNKPPGIIGVCELENSQVLDELIYNSPLENFDYSYVHYESSDWRGIDVAILYKTNCFMPLFSEAIKLSFPDDTSKKSRDILYTKGVLFGVDTLHLFVNHWPSRYSGYMKTSGARNYAAQILKNRVDSILLSNDNSLIVIMGDMNDGPEDESLNEILDAKIVIEDDPNNLTLYNLVAASNPGEGTLKYQGKWQIFDHIIVNGQLLSEHSSLHVTDKEAIIFKPDYLLEDDKKFLGVKPYRTYIGFSYNKGFSDHLPVLIHIESNID